MMLLQLLQRPHYADEEIRLCPNSQVWMIDWMKMLQGILDPKQHSYRSGAARLTYAFRDYWWSTLHYSGSYQCQHSVLNVIFQTIGCEGLERL